MKTVETPSRRYSLHTLLHAKRSFIGLVTHMQVLSLTHRLSALQPKLQAHMSQCSASRLTCIDCNVTFGRHDVNSHSKCVTEHEKYAQGLTKAPGFGGAQQMPSQESGAAKISAEDTSIPAGPPWRCRRAFTSFISAPDSKDTCRYLALSICCRVVYTQPEHKI